MASEAVAGSSAEGLTPAQKLMQEHDHNVTVEDVPDEEDLAHPPPSAKSATDAPLSEKAAGKQKASDTLAPKKPALNTSSEEAFPALGPVKPRAQAPVAPTWGKKPAAVTSNGVNGDAASNGTSRASTPASIPVGRGPALPSMNIPGKHTERISFSPNQLTPRQQLKKPINDIIRDINRRSKAKLELKSGPGGTVIFESTGPVDAVRQTLKEIANEVGSKVSISCMLGNRKLTISAICRCPHPRLRPRAHHRPSRVQDSGHQQAHRRPHPGPQGRGWRG
jgi:hypothetical protein